VDDGANGRLCSVGDETCFVEALGQVLLDPLRLLDMKRESLKRAHLYDIEKVADSYESLFNEEAFTT